MLLPHQGSEAHPTFLELAANIGKSVVSSRLDYCNSLMYGISRTNMKKPQRVQNALIRVICLLGPRDSVSGARRDLHWLPIEQQITFKIAVPYCRRRSAPPYLCDLVHDYLPRRDPATGRLLWFHEQRRLQRSAPLASQHQPFGMTFLSNWDSLLILMDLNLNSKLIFLLRVNHSLLNLFRLLGVLLNFLELNLFSNLTLQLSGMHKCLKTEQCHV